MSKIQFKTYIKHSKEFLDILKESKVEISIRTITHSKPILVFWISPEGLIVDAKTSHNDNPPNNDRSVLSDKIHKGYLRGRVAFIGNVLYTVVYGEGSPPLSKRQLSLLKRAYPRLLNFLKDEKNIDQDKIDSLVFIQEDGEDIII